MLILEPTAGEKTITIAPRSAYYNALKSRALNDGGVFESSNCFTLFSGINYSINLRRDGDGKEETITGVSIDGITNFTQIKFLPTILQEDSTYYLEITNEGNLFYRDKIYVTPQTSTERETNKYEIGSGKIYKPFSDSDDNTYII